MISTFQNSWSPEEQALFNPCYFATLIWLAASGYGGETGLGFELAFLIPPMVLHPTISVALPRNVQTSLASWTSSHPLECLNIGDETKRLLPFVRAALLFGAQYHLLGINGVNIMPNRDLAQKIRRSPILRTEKIRSAHSRAKFLGKWFATTGDPTTIYVLLGLRP
ncbi:MAG: hypothetical protein JRN15_10705 [Nitrososphaerota archaeon]|nr:hypothetical protein [Nitrososphaerota archaeon]